MVRIGTTIFLLPIAFIHSATLQSNHKQCPQCAQLVHVDAKICIYCGNEFEELPSEKPKDNILIPITFCVVVILLLNMCVFKG